MTRSDPLEVARPHGVAVIAWETPGTVAKHGGVEWWVPQMSRPGISDQGNAA